MGLISDEKDLLFLWYRNNIAPSLKDVMVRSLYNYYKSLIKLWIVVITSLDLTIARVGLSRL